MNNLNHFFIFYAVIVAVAGVRLIVYLAEKCQSMMNDGQDDSEDIGKCNKKVVPLLNKLISI